MKYDVFMSYAREDAMAVRSLVSAFEAEGHTVFWDRHIQPGQHWSDVLENAMRESRVVVVVWSAASVTSAWVKAEATEAMAQRKLVPVRIDSATIPMPFGQVQTADIALNRPLHEQGLSIAAVMAGLRDAGVAAPGVSASPTLATGSAGRVVDWRHAFLSMEGRLGRRDYWICYLALVPISVVCIVLVEYLVGASAKDAALDVKVKASVFVFFLTLYPRVAILIKRLHDFGWSGWWTLPMAAISLLQTAAIPGLESAIAAERNLAWFLTVVIWIIVIFVGARAGNPGANKYGPKPV